MRVLTIRQAEILDFIVCYINVHNQPPSTREIGTQFGFVSTNSVTDHLNSLARKGYIHRHAAISRGIQLTTKTRDDLLCNAVYNWWPVLEEKE